MDDPAFDNSTVSKWCFLISLALIGTLPGHFIGHGNHIEQLPGILAMMDPEYLPNDAFTQASVEYGPRYYYYQLVAKLGLVLSLPVAMLLLLLLGNGMGLWVTWQAAEYLLPNRKSAPYLTACAAIPFFSLNFLIPTALAWPISLAALLSGLQQKPLLAAGLSMLATILHPVLGLPMGGLALAVSLIGGLCEHHKAPTTTRGLSEILLRHFLAGAALLGMTFVVWVLPVKNSLNTADFIHIVAEYRHPHHYLLSHFPPIYFLNRACLVAAIFIAIGIYRRSLNLVPTSCTIVQLWSLVGAVLLLFLCGYVFVEVFPIRAVTTLQTERITQLLSWVAYLLVGCLAADTLERCSGWFSRLLALLLIASCFASDVIMLTAIGVTCAARANASAASIRARQSTAAYLIGLASIIVLFIGFALTPLDSLPRLLATIALLGYWLLTSQRPWSSAWHFVFPIGFGLAMGGLYFVGQYPHSPNVVFLAAPKFTLTDRLPNDPYRDNFEFAKASTPSDVIFIVPPGAGRMRIVGRRAVAADFKAFPFQDDAIREWFQKSIEFYGEDVGTEEIKNEFYNALSDERMMTLAQKYDAKFAVVPNEKETRFKEVFRGKSYKTIALEAK